MSMLQELIESADRLCHTLDILAENEKKFNTNICSEFERYSWEIYRMRDHIEIIKQECGG